MDFPLHGLSNHRPAIAGDFHLEDEVFGRVTKNVFRGVETTKGHLAHPPVYRKVNKMALSLLKNNSIKHLVELDGIEPTTS